MKVSSVIQGLLDNKKEYQDHLMDVITEPLILSFQAMYESNLKTAEARAHGPLQSFQDLLTKIPSWNQMMVTEQYEKLRERSGCSYIQDLIRAILITYVKINMASQKGTTDIQKFKLRVPSGENFIHRCMILAAREMWKQPYLLYHQARTIERQKNLVELENIVRKAIRGAIRMYVPMEQLVLHVNEASNEPAEESSEYEREESEDSSSEEEESETEEEESEDEELEESEDEESESEEEDPDTHVEIIHKDENVATLESEETEDFTAEPEGEEPVVEEPTEQPKVEEIVEATVEPEAAVEEPETAEAEEEIKGLFIHSPRDNASSSSSESEAEDVFETQEAPVAPEERPVEERKEITIMGKDKDKQMAYGAMLLNRGQLHRPKISRNTFTTPKSNAFF